MMQGSGMLRAAGAAAMLLGAGAAQAAQPPAGSFYQLTVTTSFEPSFSDCWTFSNNGRFIVSHGGGLGSFPYQLTGLNTQAGHFQAVWRGRISIGFSGVAAGGSIAGDAVDSLDRTYSFTGKQVGGCPAVAAAARAFQRQ
jgi:hypothetical protein